MIENPPKIVGKTYSLFGDFDSTDEFYKFIDNTLNELLTTYKNEINLLEILQLAGKSKKQYNEFISCNDILKKSESQFTSYTPGVKEHKKEQPVFKFWESVMRLDEWQYHLYMLEFELINRINRKKFFACDAKIALLPHCLRDLSKDCKASQNGLDYQCKHCSKNCFINEASKILSEQGIEPYIWMTSNLRTIARNNYKEKKSLGVLGIACIPELIRGMRACQKKGLPVIGMPLDANRCIRWMGDFNPNSINLEMLKKIMTSSK
jgi:hypothetical protein